jgi:ABC-type multidrug transport system ATPase subunit
MEISRSDTLVLDIKDETYRNPDFTFTWDDVSLKVQVGKKEWKQLLWNMSGSVSAGQMVAIMGGSGAGKSTLLNVLTGRIGAGELTGQILVGNEPRRPETWQTDCGYVEQDDLMHRNLTVEETLLYASKFRLPSSMSLKSKKARVDEIIMDLGLNACRHTPIGGGDLRGISGGERKRVSIGIELITHPKVLILDEPTSGLDAFTAFNVIKMVKELAEKRNLVVLMTVHQPRTDILKIMDKILLLSMGKTVFFGTNDEALKHFASLGFVLPLETNPSDFYLDTITLDQRTPELFEKSKSNVDMLYQKWQQVKPNVKHMIVDAKDLQKKTIEKNSIFVEFFTLLSRNSVISTRDRSTIYAKIFSSIFIFLILGFVFYQSGNDSRGVQNKVGVLFFLTINLALSNVIPYLGAFVMEREITKRERASNSYSAVSAFFAKWFAILPLAMAGSIIIIPPVYWMIGLYPSALKFAIFAAVLLVHTAVSTTWGMLIGASVPNITVGQIIAPLVMTVLLLFGGPLVSLDLVPLAFRWIPWISPMTQSTKALVQNEFVDAVMDCSNKNLLCYTSGQQVIEQMSLQSPTIWYCVGINVLVAIGCLIAGVIMFEFKSRPLLRLK